MQSSCISVQMLLFDLPQRKEYDTQWCQNISAASEKPPYPDHYLLSWTQQILRSTKPDVNHRRVMQSSCITVQMDLPQWKEYDTQLCQTLT